MKRYGNLFDQICDLNNIKRAFYRAAQGKTSRRTVQWALDRIDTLAPKLRDALLNGTYKTSQYKTRVIYEPKERTIYILPFYPDRVVHHAVMAVIEPLLDKLMYYHSYACRPGKGQTKGSAVCMKYVKKYTYCLKGDVSKFYPSVNHAVLKELIRRKFKDKRLLALLDEIIDSAEGETNVPIGNYLSQWFGNFYLNELDNLVKHTLHCKPYIRYCDDFVLFSNDKHQLRAWAEQIKNFCAERLKLRLSKCNIFKTNQGVDFLGYRHFHNGRLILRKRTALRIRRRLRGIERMLNNKSKRLVRRHALGQVASAMGMLKHCQSKGLSEAMHVNELFRTFRNEIGYFIKVGKLKMQGYPKTLNSWDDVEYVVANFDKAEWQADLEGLIRDDVLNMWVAEKELTVDEEGVVDAKHKVEESQDMQHEGEPEMVEVTNPETGEVTQEPKKIRTQYKLIPCLTCRLAIFKNCTTEKELNAAVKEVKALLKKGGNTAKAEA